MRFVATFRSAAMLLLALLVASASAQYPGGPGGGGGRGGMGGGGGGPMREPMRGAGPGSSPMIQVQLDQLEDALKLTAEQRPEWSRYADGVATLMDQLAQARQPGGPAPGSAVDQLDALSATARSRVAAIADIADAGKRLYLLLTPEQKAIADRRLARIVAPALGLPGASR